MIAKTSNRHWILSSVIIKTIIARQICWSLFLLLWFKTSSKQESFAQSSTTAPTLLKQALVHQGSEYQDFLETQWTFLQVLFYLSNFILPLSFPQICLDPALFKQQTFEVFLSFGGYQLKSDGQLSCHQTF